MGAGWIVLGSDDPLTWQMLPSNHILVCSSLSDDAKAGILGRATAKLFNVSCKRHNGLPSGGKKASCGPLAVGLDARQGAIGS